MISSRTSRSAESGHRETRVGTVETIEIRFASSQGPTSTPERTSERGAGTRQAPYAQASHISSQLASKATDSPAITRSPGPIGADCRNIRDSASTKAAALRWETATPLGLPVEPEVKMTQASSPGEGACGAAGASAAPGASADASDVLEAPAVAGPNPPGDEPAGSGAGPAVVRVMTRPSPITARAADSSKTTRARSSGSSASTGT